MLHFYYVKFNSIKSGKNATVDSDMALVLHLTDRCVGHRKCFNHRVFNMADEDTDPQWTLIFRNNCQSMDQAGEEKADNIAVCVAIYSGCIGSRMAKLPVILLQDDIYICSVH